MLIGYLNRMKSAYNNCTQLCCRQLMHEVNLTCSVNKTIENNSLCQAGMDSESALNAIVRYTMSLWRRIILGMQFFHQLFILPMEGPALQPDFYPHTSFSFSCHSCDSLLSCLFTFMFFSQAFLFCHMINQCFQGIQMLDNGSFAKDLTTS